MELTSAGQKLVMSLDSRKKSVSIPKEFKGRFFIDIGGKVTEITKEKEFTFPEVKDDTNIGYGWSAK